MATAHKIKLIRDSKGISASFIARKLNISKTYLSLMENNKKTIPDEILIQLARLYSVKVSELK